MIFSYGSVKVAITLIVTLLALSKLYIEGIINLSTRHNYLRLSGVIVCEILLGIPIVSFICNFASGFLVIPSVLALLVLVYVMLRLIRKAAGVELVAKWKKYQSEPIGYYYGFVNIKLLIAFIFSFTFLADIVLIIILLM